MIGGRRPLKGRKAGDRRVRVERPHAPYFRYAGPGQLIAKPAASVPLTPGAKALRPDPRRRLRSAALDRGGDRRAPVQAQGPGHLQLRRHQLVGLRDRGDPAGPRPGRRRARCSCPSRSSIAIALLLAVVSVSYRQVCRAYPNGGGAYVVARTNLAPIAGLIAAAALLIDYVMTVAVSTAAAIAQIQSVIPAAYDFRIEIAFVSISLITIANLRGLRESGNIFAVPTYLFVGLALGDRGDRRLSDRRPTPSSRCRPAPDYVPFGTEAVGILLLLKAFAGGSVALTGVEAIANGVPAFKPPESKNAANTMTTMAVLLAVLFVGLTVVAVAYDLRPTDAKAARPSWRSSPRRRSARALCSS